jgi:tetratricopeptide (TPR) repeat protein
MPPEEVAQVYYNLGNAYFELEKYELAVSAYLNALALDASLPQAGYNLARVYIEKKEYERGLAALEELLEEDPGNSLILSTIGWTYYLMEDFEKALEIFGEILERTPTDQHGLYNAAVLSWKLDRKEEALGYFRRLFSETGEDETQYRIASLLMDMERWDEAIDVLDDYLSRKPDDPNAYYDLGIAYTAERYYGKALAAFEAGIEIKKTDPLFHFERAVILLLYIENVDEGLKALEAAVKSGFKDSERILGLLRADELVFDDEVRRFFDAKGLLPEEAEALGEEEESGEADTPTEGEPEAPPLDVPADLPADESSPESTSDSQEPPSQN